MKGRRNSVRTDFCMRVLVPLCFVGCGYWSMTGTARPKHLADWTLCLLDDHALVEIKDYDPAAAAQDIADFADARFPKPGHAGHAVLLADTEWGKSAFR